MVGDLMVGPEDVRIEQLADGGYHLYVRRKPGLGSILLTESTKDPEHKTDNYAYRAPEWNPINGDEKRILDGKAILASAKIWSLIDSSPEKDPVFGQAFHVFIPWVVAWGYSWGRHGETFIHDGTFINIRAFALPFADYRAAFQENPYLIRVTQKLHAAPPAVKPPPAPPPEVMAPPEPKPPEKEPDLSLYIPKTVDDFRTIADAGKGEAHLVEKPEDIAPEIGRLMDKAKGKSLDLVLCLDTTDSMGNDIDAVKASLPGIIQDRIAGFTSVRLGLVLYKDYFEEYVVKHFDFTVDVPKMLANVQSVRVGGGRDIPEAVYEALYEALTTYPWMAERKMIILIGDAPAHPLPRGKIDRAMVEAESGKRGIEMDTIILPD